MFYEIYKEQNTYTQIIDNKFKSEKIINEIRQSSENLTRLARLYTNTKDTLYRNQFFEVLNINKGQSPRPHYFNRVYWNVLTTKDKQPPFAKSIKKSARELIKESDFDPKEEEAIMRALNNSLALTRIEIEAFTTLDGQHGDKIIDEQENQKKAINMVNSEHYHKQVILIMEDLNKAYEWLETRTNKNINALNAKISGKIILVSIIFFFLLIGILLIIYDTLNLKKDTINQLQDSVEKKTKELRDLNTSKDLFFSIIAHDLKGPFNSLIGFSNLMFDEVKASKNKELLDTVNIIKKASENTFELLQNLLEWAQMQSGRIKFNREYVSLNKILDQVLNISTIQSRQKNIEIITAVSHTCFMVFVDRNMIRTVLRNLISNAIKYSHENGTIKVSCIIEDDTVKVSVSDNGVGISQENVDRLFKLKYSQKTLGTYGEKGTGLGLILVKDFIDKHNGKIWVESELGKGSTFIFTIPIA
ncbi:sensor histidine kinase [Gelatiniphilus marinus]|uniref:histidine kinase n=1 Tax=Gelatiniphilus marinus TaxID=1759464 RepID=A0ABW5JVB4_9FLAO